LLKVDRSFVRGIPSDTRSVEIVRTIVTLAHNLGLLALAEGVETQEQAVTLRALGCELGQGFFYSPPVGAGVAERSIGNHLPVACAFAID